MPETLPDDDLLPHFTRRIVTTGDVAINLATAGTGPAVLMLHGYPQTHVMWHRIAPRLAEKYTVVLTDMRGQGDSAKPPGGPTHREYAKRTLARDNYLVMTELGFERFAVVGHDRGARVAHRMALDYADSVAALAVLDVLPNRYTLRHIDYLVAQKYFHWFFLGVEDPLPERLIAAMPEQWVRSAMTFAAGPDSRGLEEAAIREYVRCFADPAAIHAGCEDFRAGSRADLMDDDADHALGKRVTCPVLALWGRDGYGGFYGDAVLDAWREYATDVRGRVLPCGHWVPEQAAPEVIAELTDFLDEPMSAHT
ncbi:MULTISPECIES: alpha/beta fold hydrolase [unclassified Nocardia]|uniref:alpha/beta fold hydrolase n=1 Tax=unclassified Nocardia TaxID=2637762 RepID=UPI001CE40A46|nr:MULTISPECIES: alpha/beta hydrolase [unclassified Nocardia]